ncbi:unnamed protein product [Blepharisma stoltei]|uniref:PPM-type phosphatase domain-containing protein n=1 Tax=Blepharisma stoltei TaxID=1481888 RepID=A0AAU9IH85_9CILI|nr:unnamed protein product [Blepharisma stoltei]
MSILSHPGSLRSFKIASDPASKTQTQPDIKELRDLKILSKKFLIQKPTLTSRLNSGRPESHNVPRRLPGIIPPRSNPSVKSTRNISESRKRLMSAGRRAQSIADQPTIFSRLKNYVISCTYKSRTGERDGSTKSQNQDSYIIRPFLRGAKGQYLFSVCDGHGKNGHLVSGFIKEKFPMLIESNLPFSFPDQNQISLCLQKSIIEVAKYLEESKIPIESSGSTLNSILISGEKLVCANLGDSRAVLGSFKDGWRSKDLSRDHKPNLPDEKARILNSNGRVEPKYSAHGEELGPDRVWTDDVHASGLAMSRSIGDSRVHKVGVITEPELVYHQIMPEDKFAIIASDGVWEFMSSEEAVEIVGKTWQAGRSDICCDNLVSEALERWRLNEDSVDDITVIIIFFSFSHKKC